MFNNQINYKLIKFLKEYCWDDILSLAVEYPDKSSLYIRFPTIEMFDRTLSQEVTNSPSKIIDDLESALKEIDLPADKSFDDEIHVRITEVPVKTRIGDLRSKHLGKLIAIEGMIRKATEVRPRCIKAAFQCLRCGHITYVDQVGFKFEEPIAGCESDICGKRGPFTVLLEDSIFVDAQKLQIQEPPEDLRGTQAQSLEIDADNDLTGLLIPGERVIITGILKSRQRTLKDGKSTFFDIILEANSIERLDTSFDEVNISSEDEAKIKTLAQDPDIYYKMENSIAPIINGMAEVKQAMVLQQFSGVPKFTPDGSYLRGDIHTLFVGDPGKAKTKAMKSSQARSPRAVFTSGKATTAGGLTAVVVKDEKFGEGRWTVEGGALVMADRGIAFIDEADKMRPSDRDALHDAMEQQEINLSKAGIMATLKTRTSVCMAANPKYGKFDKYEGLAEQIDMPPSLLSRFDLIFIILDTPNPEEDERISAHILKTHRAGEIRQQRENNIISVSTVLAEEIEKHLTPEISPDLFRKYVAYARKHVFPVLSDDAVSNIHKFYTTLRKKGAESKTKSIPITTRQEEAIVRLAEASARVRLGPEVTLGDAERATDLMTFCLLNVGLDPKSGEIDAGILNSGVSKDQRETVRILKSVIRELTGSYSKGLVPIVEVISRAVSQGIEKERLEKALDRLIKKGEILKPDETHVKVIA